MKRFGLLGKTLKHSFSKNYFEKKFERENISGYTYENFELASIEEVKTLIENDPDIQGFNVTIPYKEEILPFLNGMSREVEEIKACNCVRIVENKLYGFNTDVIGFRKTLETSLGPNHKKALILGSGGASKAVQYVLDQLKIDYLVVSRHKDFNRIGYEDLSREIVREHTLIVNTTPLGMYPNINADPPFPYDFLSPAHFLYDLIYNPPKTKFLEQGEKQGAKIHNGHDMLVLQAEESWRIWMDEDISTLVQ